MKAPQKTLQVAIAQINPCVGDFDLNKQKILESIADARETDADVVVFPEMVVSGYPPEDLLFRPAFLKYVEGVLDDICQASIDMTVVVGAPVLKTDAQGQGKLYNMAVVFQNGKRIADYAKQHLPNYRVFDEERYFVAGKETVIIPINGIKTAILICEDIWQPAPAKSAKAQGAEAIIVLNASPFRHNKASERLTILQRRATENQVAIVYANLVGGQDELVFDGHSLVVDQLGQLIFQADTFAECTYRTEVSISTDSSIKPAQDPAEADSSFEVKTTNEAISLYLPSEEEQVYEALVTGVRDYIDKNGFSGVMVGLSGGIDSALTLAIAVDALGADNVEAVMMPFHYTAEISVTDARKQAETLGVNYHEIPIETVFNGFMDLLSDVFGDLERDVTEENIQARSRGVILMAMSNKLGKMVLATGNKSEMSMGYATLYGDMAGGYAPLKDVYKTLVYSLSKYRNQCGLFNEDEQGDDNKENKEYIGKNEIIPNRVITRPPSAELAPDQKDEDSLPPYDVLDEILRLFIEEFQSVDEIVAQGFERETVHFVTDRVLLNEHKRRQSAPGIRVTRRAFGKDRRYPISSAYRKYLSS